jgi:hypothetical protein
MTIVPDDCITCEIIVGKKLRDRVFVEAINDKTVKDGTAFYPAVARYMRFYHNNGHSA